MKDLERVGDIAANLAERALELNREPELRTGPTVTVMTRSACRMLQRSLDAFVKQDTTRARQVIASDDELDGLQKALFREMLAVMAEDPRTISRGLGWIIVAKNLERVGDHASNIAEMVVMMVEGKDIRHWNKVPQQ